MIRTKKICPVGLVVAMLFVVPVFKAQAQTVGLKTNLLYDATTTPNLGLEVSLGGHSSVQVFYGYNPWKFSDRKSLRHWSVMPEYRYWKRKPFEGWFGGIHLVGGEFNVGGVTLPLGIYKSIKDTQNEGTYYGGGLTLGYAWPIGCHWNLEAAIGVGYVHRKFDKYVNEYCGDFLGTHHKNYVGPTKLALNIVYLFGNGRCAKPEVIEVPTTNEIAFKPRFALPFFEPVAEPGKERAFNGSAFLDFPVNKTVIYRDYRNNQVELDKVVETVREINSDPNITITRLTIHGYASPEGSYANNTRLARERSAAFMEYLRSLFSFSDEVTDVQSTPEDWDGLRRAVESGSLPHRTELLAVINSNLEPDAKDRKLRKDYPQDYAVILKDIYPALRHSDYTVNYSIRPFTAEEARELIKTKPQQLSLNEMFLAAQLCEPGSQEYNDIFATAVRMYPDSETTNLNAAIIALQRKDFSEAERYLQKAGDSHQALNARGVLAAYQGKMDEARRLLEEAQQQGSADAARNLNELRLMQ